MKKILYIVPHLSTGGLPQYTLKMMEEFSKEFEVYCIEYQDITGGVLVVQRNKIVSLLNNKFFSLPEDKSVMIDIITKISPQIIHFQEIPDSFVDIDLLEKIYKHDRNYDIVISTHGSMTNPSKIIFGADKYVLVSEWSKNKFSEVFDASICDIWEYPITKMNYDKDEAKKELGFDSKYKHVLNVGLFTPGKNQKELVELAKQLKNHNIMFHFVGNQAANFKDYWEPIMKDFPHNCIWHGERDDVDKFYKAADAFYFTSNFELNPLVVKEALSYGLPTFIKKLDTYKNAYDDRVIYITEDSDENIKQLIGVLEKNNQTNKSKSIVAMHILTDIDTEREVDSMISLTKLENHGIEYVPCVNRRYTEMPPLETCEYPERISFESGGKLTPGHYGCYLGHKNAILDGIQKNKDYILIFECDAIIDTTYEEFIDKLNFACEILNETDLLMFSFGFHNNTHVVDRFNDYWTVNKFYGAHAYIIPKKSYDIFKNLFENEKWNVTDLLYAEKLQGFKTGIFEKPITKQSAGYSILDKVYHEERY